MRHKDGIHLLTYILLLLPVVYIGWRCLNYTSGVLPDSDAAIFVNIAHHLINGKVLYRDVWDHKQPVIFLINALALKLGDGTFNSIRVAERYFAICAAFAFFVITARTFISSWITAIFTILFLIYFYSPLTFTMGNFTEEYASVFMLFGILYTLESIRQKSTALIILSGIFFSVSVFTKEPFLLSALPWIVYLMAKKEGRPKKLLYLAVGSVLPLIIAIIYFIHTETLNNWLNVIYFNLAASKYGLVHTSAISERIAASVNIFTKLVLFARTVDIFFAAGVISVFQRSFVREYKHIPVVIVLWFIMSLIAVNIQNNHFNHYYIQVVPGFIMAAASGAAFLMFNLRRVAGRITSTVSIFAVLILSVIIFDRDIAKTAYDMITSEALTVADEPIAIYIKEHTQKSDAIWVPSYDKYIYLQSGRLSPTKYLFMFPHIFITPTMNETSEEKLRCLREDLQRNPPVFIFITHLTELDYLGPAGIPQWINNNYTLDSTWYNGLLLRKT
ncbi:MAG: glycosyltransferase family 39 protein [Nitrospirae bacterium]|nr:glycosyltransferase family 39 protein [Nitrospirota bacterium]